MFSRLIASFSLLLLLGCRVSSHPVAPAASLAPASSQPAALSLPSALASPGPIVFETVVAADWVVDRGGLINLEHPRAKAAGLAKGNEPIQIYFYALRHPTQGLFLVDTGVERALRDAPKDAAIRGLVASFIKMETLKVHQDTRSWLEAQTESVRGVFLTHLHADHVMGLPDLPQETPLYVGPGESRARAAMNAATRRTYRRLLADRPALQEWRFAPDAAGQFDGLVDIFGDGSAWAISVPGHTAGSVAYLLRTTRGPVLLVGDTCHTSWGWENEVEPGSFTADQEQNAAQLSRLRRLVAANAGIEVHLGHQALPSGTPQ